MELRLRERVDHDRTGPRELADDAGDVLLLQVAAAALLLGSEALGVGASQALQESPDVVTASLLAVRDDVETGLLLVDQGQPHGVVLGLAQTLGDRVLYLACRCLDTGLSGSIQSQHPPAARENDARSRNQIKTSRALDEKDATPSVSLTSLCGATTAISGLRFGLRLSPPAAFHGAVPLSEGF